VEYPRAVPQAETQNALSSVDRALRLLDELAEHGPLGATDLANRLGTAKATAFRLARTLQARGYVVQNPDSTYRLGPRCLLLATGVHASLDLRRDLLPVLEALHAETDETVQLSALDGPDVVYLEQLLSPKPVLSVGQIGSRAPAHCVSGGLAQLAVAPPEAVDALLTKPLRRWTAATIVDHAALRRELDATRVRGYAVNRGAFREDVGGVGAAVMGPHGRPVAAVNICVPLYRLEDASIGRLGGLAAHAAADASRLLGVSVVAG
jgi:DNA-binding IclR family transcriptional regulator